MVGELPAPKVVDEALLGEDVHRRTREEGPPEAAAEGAADVLAVGDRLHLTGSRIHHDHRPVDGRVVGIARESRRVDEEHLRVVSLEPPLEPADAKDRSDEPRRRAVEVDLALLVDDPRGRPHAPGVVETDPPAVAERRRVRRRVRRKLQEGREPDLELLGTVDVSRRNPSAGLVEPPRIGPIPAPIPALLPGAAQHGASSPDGPPAPLLAPPLAHSRSLAFELHRLPGVLQRVGGALEPRQRVVASRLRGEHGRLVRGEVPAGLVVDHHGGREGPADESERRQDDEHHDQRHRGAPARTVLSERPHHLTTPRRSTTTTAVRWVR